MDNWIYEKINKINSLEDRALLNKIMLSVFSSLEEYTKARYDSIEKSVLSDIKINRKKYTMYTSIVSRDKLNPISEFLFPILEEDKEESFYEINAIRKAIIYKEDLFLFNVFLECDYLKILEIINEKKEFYGEIKTNKKIYRGKFIIKSNDKYKEKIRILYETFIFNNIPWETVNVPYINKMVDVYLIGIEDEISTDEEITKININFEEYSELVKYNMVPIWNLRECDIKTNGFAKPCIDKVNYEHIIAVNAENGYLIKLSSDNNIGNIEFREGNISIITTERERNRWGIFEFTPYVKAEEDILEYQIMDNGQMDTYSNKISISGNQNIKTKGELIRLINSYNISKYITFKDVRIIKPRQEKDETYNLNEFIVDEIRDGEINKVLMLYLSPCEHEEISEYLYRDILSFIVSRVQFIYPEYKCEGRLI